MKIGRRYLFVHRVVLMHGGLHKLSEIIPRMSNSSGSDGRKQREKKLKKFNDKDFGFWKM